MMPLYVGGMGEEALGDRLRRLREARGLSQDRLAKLADVSPGQIYMIESGKRRRMRESTAERVAAALHVTQTYLECGVAFPLVDGTGWPEIETWLRARADLRDEGNIQHVIGTYRRLQELEELRAWRAASTTTEALPEITEEEARDRDLAAFDDPERAERMRREAENWADEDPS